MMQEAKIAGSGADPAEAGVARPVSVVAGGPQCKASHGAMQANHALHHYNRYKPCSPLIINYNQND